MLQGFLKSKENFWSGSLIIVFLVIYHYYTDVGPGGGRYLDLVWTWVCHTVRPLFKKITQHCETYEPTNCCVRKLHNLCTILHNLCTILNKLCNFFTQQLVGSYVSQCCVIF